MQEEQVVQLVRTGLSHPFREREIDRPFDCLSLDAIILRPFGRTKTRNGMKFLPVAIFDTIQNLLSLARTGHQNRVVEFGQNKLMETRKYAIDKRKNTK